MYRICAAALALLLAPLPAAAEDWYRLPVTGDAGYSFVDLDSVQAKDGHVLATSLSIHMPVIPGTRFRWMLIEGEYDCAARSTHFLHVKGFSPERELLAEVGEIYGGRFIPAGAGTEADAIVDFVCNVSRKDAVQVRDPWTVLPPKSDE